MNKSNLIIALLICLLGFAVYANSLKNEFVWDDKVYITNDPHITSLRYIKDAFLFPLGNFSDWPQLAKPFYRPLQSASFMTDYFLWGKDPFGYHLTNILFHILAAIASYFFVYKISRNYLISFMASLIFLIHPVQTEAVTYISGRADPMVFFFMLWALILYIRSKENNGKLFYFMLSLSVFILAICSKELAIIFPVILILYDAYKKEPSRRYKSLPYGRYLPYILIIVVFLILHKKITTAVESQASPLIERFMISGYILFKYIKLLFLPFGLHMEYDVPKPSDAIIFLSFVFVAVIFLLIYISRKRCRLVYFGALWFFITLFPMLNIIKELNAPMSEHWLYVPILGFGVIVGELLDLARKKMDKAHLNRIGRILAALIVASIVIYYSSITILRNLDWRNNLTFLTKTLEFSPNSARVAMDIAIGYSENKDFNKAEKYFKKAVSLNPNLRNAHYNFASMYEKKGDINLAIEEYNNEIKANPKNTGAMNNLGVLYKETKKYNLAVQQYNKILKISPNNIAAYYNLGVVSLAMGEEDNAKGYFRKVLSLDPNFELAKKALKRLPPD